MSAYIDQLLEEYKSAKQSQRLAETEASLLKDRIIAATEGRDYVSSAGRVTHVTRSYLKTDTEALLKRIANNATLRRVVMPFVREFTSEYYRIS